jgi:hypothetical protein
VTWIEVTRDEQRLARIEVMACRSAGLPVDPLVKAIAAAEPHSPEWIARQDEEEPTNDMSEAMDRGLTSMLAAEFPHITRGEIYRADQEPEDAERVERERREFLQQVASSRGWLSRLFGR